MCIPLQTLSVSVRYAIYLSCNSPNSSKSVQTDLAHLITEYFEMELQYREIVEILFLNHGIHVSLRHVKSILRNKGFSRRKNYSDLNSVVNFVVHQIETSGKLHGYRWMYQKCTLNGLKVKKEHVRLILQTFDPIGVETRLRRRLRRREYSLKGPNFCWHIDSYDKLKFYGLCINGCIDGFSRKIIWLKVGRTSSNPRVIARYYINAVEEHGGYPYFMRGDMGTENGTVAAMQTFFARAEVRRSDPFIYGKSTMNTRIESWWGRECCQIWIEKMKHLKNRGHFTGSELDINLIQFCFSKSLQDELDETVKVWNAHKLRRSRDNVLSGRPMNMYLFPELNDVQDYICPVSVDEIDVCRMECAIEDDFPCEEELFELGCAYMQENAIDPPTNILEANRLYRQLRLWVLSQI